MNKRIRLKVAMVEKGVTGRELAAHLGVHESVVSMVANGRYNLSEDQQRKVADYLGKPIAKLFK